MSVRMKLTHSKTGSRRAHHNASAPRLVVTKTGVRRRHFVDTDTGMYRGKQIISVGAPKKKAPKKATVTEKKQKEEDKPASTGAKK